MSDVIRVRNLAVYARHGVFAAEREIGQRFYIDIAIETDLKTAAATDEIGDTISYADMIAVATEAFTETAEQLLETLAERLAARMLERFPGADAVDIAIRKPSAPIAAVFDYVEVEIRRTRRG
jgi:7,8-dihydroneopterin aldolase/epimerase/oxygenase